jgi:hypothetical protein
MAVPKPSSVVQKNTKFPIANAIIDLLLHFYFSAAA